MSENAARRLRTFLDDVRTVFEQVLLEPNLLPVHVHREFQRLWDESRDSVDELQDRLRAIEQGTDPSSQESLAQAGLDGESLDLKLAAVDRALYAFRDAQRATQRPGGLSAPPQDRRGVRARLRQLWERRHRPSGLLLRRTASLLRWIDVPLESLVAALGQGETIKEVKKWLEAAVADVQEGGATP